MNPLDVAVRAILAERLTGVAYSNATLYAWYLDYCQRRSALPASRTRLGVAMRRFGAVKFLTNPKIGRCWYIPTPRERIEGVPSYLGTEHMAKS